MLKKNKLFKYVNCGGEMVRKARSIFILLILFFFLTFSYGAIPAEERAALIALYNSTDGDNWTKNSGWKGNNNEPDGFSEIGSENTWHGIFLASNHVDKIALISNQLSGTIPSELGNLSNLSYLQLQSNQLTGIIPSELGNLTNLTTLWLNQNQLSGSIPSELGNLTNLTLLYLHQNQLTGSIPSELGNITKLTYLLLYQNQLTGSIPSELGNLSNLSYLQLQSNQLTGTIPSELENLTNLTLLYLDENQLTGSIPPELGNIAKLIYLLLGQNQLTGSIPSELGNLTNLTSLSLDQNQLTGSIPAELGNLTNLTSLSLYRNQFTGSIPPELENLTNLRYLYLHTNQLTGSIPPELGNLTNLIILYLDTNKLNGAVPLNLTNLTNLTSFKIVFNCLYSNNSAVRAWLLTLDPFWESYQNECVPATTITVTSPSGGESWAVGTVHGITWTSTGTVGNVKIEYSTNNGSSWATITSSTTNDGIFSWTIPNSLSSNCKVRVSEASDGDPTDENNSIFSIVPITYTLNVKSSPSNVNITVNPNDNGGLSNGSTNFVRIYDSGEQVSLTAPAIHNGRSFLRWTVDGANQAGQTIMVSMDSDHTAQAIYQASAYTLTVQSSPDSGASITITPKDNNNNGNGTTEFIRTYDSGTIVTLSAPGTYKGRKFLKWQDYGASNSNQTISVTMNKNQTVQAVYQSDTYTLSVQSSPYSGVGITMNPTDKDGKGDGSTNFNRKYDSGTNVMLTAPSSISGSSFIKWSVNGQDYSSSTIQVTMEGDQTAVALYESSNPPEIGVNRNSLNVGYIIGSNRLPTENFTIYNGGGGTLNWEISTEMFRIGLSPTSGTNWGTVEITMNPKEPGPLNPGKFRGVTYVTAPLVSNSPKEVEIKLWIKAKASPPFGEFATPVDNSTVYSSIPVTGWVLGDTGIENVKIYREDSSGIVYVGDAVMVEGARPDVETAYPEYPKNYKAGWGYMLLTNFLPNVGNGTFKLHAIATDKEGLTTSLGVKTIHVDNANAIKPFGAIDTPTQGGTASGNKFVNWGWVLTPQPNKIPLDGSTIKVFVDGVNIGNPTYNIYRSDIADLFPGYANSDGAIGYFYLNTTAYANGVHTIEWVATDSGGNTDGIGSRYFTIQNTRGNGSRMSSSRNIQGGELPDYDRLIKLLGYYSMPVQVKRGWKSNYIPKYPDKDGITTIEIRELERLEVQFPLEFTDIEGYMVSGNQFRPLPIGSTLDKNSDTFYWQPGIGFYGQYNFIFIEKTIDGGTFKRTVVVTILPKFGANKLERETRSIE